MFDKQDQMEMRAEKASELLSNHPSVVYTDYNEEYAEVWCGLSVNTLGGVEDISESFGLENPKVKVENDSEYGLVIDVWWEVSQGYMNEWRWRDVDEWIENYDFYVPGKSLESVMDG